MRWPETVGFHIVESGSKETTRKCAPGSMIGDRKLYTLQEPNLNEQLTVLPIQTLRVRTRIARIFNIRAATAKLECPGWMTARSHDCKIQCSNNETESIPKINGLKFSTQNFRVPDRRMGSQIVGSQKVTSQTAGSQRLHTHFKDWWPERLYNSSL